MKQIYKLVSTFLILVLIAGIATAAGSGGGGIGGGGFNRGSENYAPVQSAIKQAMTDGNFSLADIEGSPEYNVKILEKSDSHIKLISTTKITFKNPNGADISNLKSVGFASSGIKTWPKFQMPTTNGKITSSSSTIVDYDQEIKKSILAKINNISDVTQRNQMLKEWNNYSFESGARTFVFNETYEATYSAGTLANILPMIGTNASTDILMGFTTPINWKYTREDNLYLRILIWDEWVAWTKLDAGANGCFGLRLPVTVGLQMPNSMDRGISYNLDTNIKGQDWNAAQYSAANVICSENGNEFVARATISLDIQANIIAIGYVGPFYLIDKSVDYGQSFKTPFGPGEKFDLPTLILPPDVTGLKISEGFPPLASLWIGMGLMIEPILGSDKITANWVATGDSIGNGPIEYHDQATYNFGPVKADNFDSKTDYAKIKLSDYNYYFTICKLNLKANIQGGLDTIIGSLAIGTPYVTIVPPYDCSGITGGYHLGPHQGTTADSITGYSLVNVLLDPISIKVTSPNGGEKWRHGSTHTIKWKSTGNPGAKVKIELLRAGVLDSVIKSSTSNSGSYKWKIPSKQAPRTDYKIRITSTGNYSDMSNNNFIITT